MDIPSAAFGACAAALIAFAGFLGRRYLFGDMKRENIATLSAVTDILTKMRANDISYEEIENAVELMSRKKIVRLFAKKNRETKIEIEADEGPTQVDLTTQAYRSIQSSRIDLDYTLQDALNSVQDETQILLLESQKKWDEFVSQQIKFTGKFFEGGSLESFVRNTEEEMQIKQRIESLRYLIGMCKT